MDNKRSAPQLQKNQLIPGTYTIGIDVPVGKFDFHAVWEDCYIIVFENKNYYDSYQIKKDSSKCKYYKHVDAEGKYIPQDVIGLELDEGNILVVSGNGIVSIARSQKVVIDL